MLRPPVLKANLEPLAIGFILFLDRDTSPAVALYLFPSGLCGSVLPFVSYFKTLKKTNSTFVCEIVADVCFSLGSRQQFCGMMEFKKKTTFQLVQYPI